MAKCDNGYKRSRKHEQKNEIKRGVYSNQEREIEGKGKNTMG